MKFLSDVNIEKSIINSLKQDGYDVKSVLEINPTMKDREIVQLANNEDRIILTNDKDFGEIIFNEKQNTSGIILFRNIDKKDKIKLLKVAIKQIFDKNFFIVIRKNKIVQSTVKWEIQE